MFCKICLHHQAIKTIYLFSYIGSILPYRKSISLNYNDKSDFTSYINTK